MSSFVDQAQIHAKAGDGGAGAVSFRREAHVAEGGPDGGDGGNGGDVWLRADDNQASLLGFRDHPHRRATNGAHGSSKKKHGASGDGIEVAVPVGTVVRDLDDNLICDLTGHGDRFLLCAGGKGGHGNARFLSNKRRAPAFAEQGEHGEEGWFNLELKLMADVALVGFPNVGKSTLISVVSAARPKIADYPFTTLEPNLGVVRLSSSPGQHRDDDTEFVLADIPGLIEGAADGRGLGLTFLRHIERAKILLFLIDLGPLAPETPERQLEILRSELAAYDRELAGRPSIVVGSKSDLSAQDVDASCCELVISAPIRSGVDVLVNRLGAMISDVRSSAAAHRSESGIVIHRPLGDDLLLDSDGAGSWVLSGKAALRTVNFSDLTNEEALAEAVKRLNRLGVDKMLTRAGARDGDLVTVGSFAFTWYREGSDAGLDAAIAQAPQRRTRRERKGS